MTYMYWDFRLLAFAGPGGCQEVHRDDWYEAGATCVMAYAA